MKIILYFIIVGLLSLYAQKINIYTEHYPPYNMNNGDKLQGLSVEILDAMFKYIEPKQTLNDVKLTNWSRAYSIAQKKKNSMVFSTTRTDSRENLFKWVGPIVSTSVGIIAPKNKNIKIKDVKDLNQYRIGAVLKDVGELLLLDNGIEKKQIQYVKGENAINLSFTKMKNNRIDMFSYNTTVALANAKAEGFDTSEYEIIYTLQKGALYFAFHKETDDVIIKNWQNALDTIKQNGTYDQIIKRY